MKPGIHPEYHEINIVMTDGTQFKTRSCMGKEGDTLRLDIDPKSHPAWTGVQRMMDTGGRAPLLQKPLERLMDGSYFRLVGNAQFGVPGTTGTGSARMGDPTVINLAVQEVSL